MMMHGIGIPENDATLFARISEEFLDLIPEDEDSEIL
jgi:hypothetical protein